MSLLGKVVDDLQVELDKTRNDIATEKIQIQRVRKGRERGREEEILTLSFYSSHTVEQ